MSIVSLITFSAISVFLIKFSSHPRVIFVNASASCLARKHDPKWHLFSGFSSDAELADTVKSDDGEIWFQNFVKIRGSRQTKF